MKQKKILILDGIDGVPLGQEILAAIETIGHVCSYQAASKLTKRKLYKIRSAGHKFLRKLSNSDSFYYLPKITNDSIAHLIQEQQPDIILVIGFLYRFIDTLLIKQLQQQSGFKLLLLDTDSCNLFTRRRELIFFLENELSLYDHIFSFSQMMSNFLSEVKAYPCSYLPFAAQAIETVANNGGKEKTNDVLFVGSADMRRVFLLEKLKQFNPTIYGSRWQRHQALMSQTLYQKVNFQTLWGEKLHQQLYNSKIILNITRSTFYGVETGLNLRIFEALAAGGFLLTDYSDELADLFHLGHEIESFKCAQELEDKVAFYLKNDSAREKIAQQGYLAFKSKHHWGIRVNKMLETIA